MTGSLTYGSCGEVLPWSPRFASWAETEASDAVMRFQTYSNNAQVKNNILLFVIDDVADLMENPNVAIDVGDREYDDARASANLALWHRCEDDYELSVYLHGTLQFDELSPKKNGRIEGNFSGEARDQRTGDVIGNNVQLYFSFERSQHTPAQPFIPQADDD